MTAETSAGAGKRVCASCGGAFIGRASARFCSPACKQRAHRSRKGRNGNAAPVTVTARLASADTGHSAEAVALLAELDVELAENSAAHGLIEPLEWSAAERAIRESIACTVDRQVDLWARYHASDDDKTRLKLSGELRLLETSLARLLKAVPTDLQAQPTHRSRKASRAANARWRRASD